VQRRWRLPAAVPPVPARLRLGQGKGRLGKLLHMRGGVEEGSAVLAAGRNPELAAAASNGAGGGPDHGRRRVRSSPRLSSFIVVRCPLLR
jgi:hypothetical protein